MTNLTYNRGTYMMPVEGTTSSVTSPVIVTVGASVVRNTE